MSGWVKPDSAKAEPRATEKSRPEEDSPTKRLLIESLVALDDSRERSQQVLIGPSQLMGCARRVFFELVDQEPVNHNIDRLAAVMGTAFHTSAQEAIDLAIAQGKAEGITELTVPGIPEIGLGDGHVDWWRPGVATDWKSITLSSMRWFPGTKRWFQLDTYGFLCNRAGYKVEKLELVAIPRDGKFADIKVFTKNYEESKALEAIDWLKQRQENKRNGELPAAEPSALCNYCPFFGEGVCDGGKA